MCLVLNKHSQPYKKMLEIMNLSLIQWQIIQKNYNLAKLDSSFKYLIDFANELGFKKELCL